MHTIKVIVRRLPQCIGGILNYTEKLQSRQPTTREHTRLPVTFCDK